MKIFNHDITLYTHDKESSTALYSGRALCLTHPGDTIQMHQELRSEWDAIATHYADIGLEHTHDVIWDVSMMKIADYPEHEISVYFFGDVVNHHSTYRRVFAERDANRMQVIEYVNSKNNFIQLSETLGIPVPQTHRFNNLAEAKAFADVPFPCYVKPAVSDHGFGIVRCPDHETLMQAFAQLEPEESLQIQAEVNASTFLNLQYRMTASGAEPLLVSEQILDGCVHRGNRYPASHEPWDSVAPFAQWMGEKGMQDIFAVDVAVVPEGDRVHFVAIECNPRFNGSSYPTLAAKRLGIPEWISAAYKTELRSLKDLKLNDLTYDPKTGKGVILINWGTVKAGKVSALIAGTPAEQDAIDAELKGLLQ